MFGAKIKPEYINFGLGKYSFWLADLKRLFLVYLHGYCRLLFHRGFVGIILGEKLIAYNGDGCENYKTCNKCYEKCFETLHDVISLHMLVYHTDYKNSTAFSKKHKKIFNSQVFTNII